MADPQTLSALMMQQLPGLVVTGLVAVVGCGVKFLRDMARSVEQLNQNISIMVHRLNLHDEKLEDHEGRLRGVEIKVAAEIGKE